MNLILLLLAVSTAHLASAGKDGTSFELEPLFRERPTTTKTTRDSNDHLAKSLMRFGIELFKAHCTIEPGFFALPTLGISLILQLLRHGAEKPALQRLNKALGYATTDEPAAGTDQLRKLVDWTKQLAYYGARVNYTILHAYGSDLEDSFMEEIDGLFGSTPRRLESWDDVTSGKAMCEWSEDAGLSLSYNHSFAGEESLVLASFATFAWNFHVGENSIRPLEDDFYYNNKRVLRNFEYVEVTGRMPYMELYFVRRSKGPRVISVAQCLELRSTNLHLSTVLVVPKKRSHIVDLEQSLDEPTVSHVLSSLKMHPLIATLPRRLYLESAGDLVETLELNEDLAHVLNGNTRDFKKIVRSRPIKVGPAPYQASYSHDWITGSRIEASSGPSDDIYTELLANRVFVIMQIDRSDPHRPLLLSMGRNGWVPDVTD